MPPKGYKNLPSIKAGLFKALAEIADSKDMRLSELAQSMLRSYVQIAKRELPSLNEYVIQALEHFLTCSKLEPSERMRLIVLKYDGKCLRCKHVVKAGNWALYGRGVGIVCMDCYVERIGDKALVAKYLKLREWQQISKALKSECERYAQELEDFRLFDKLKGMDEKVDTLSKAMMQYLSEKLGSPDEQQALEDIIRELKELRALTTTIRERYKKLAERKKQPKSVYA